MTVNKIGRDYLIAAVVLLMSHNLIAEDYLAMNLEDLLNVSVTGSTLREESLQTVPSSVTVFTHQEIKTLGLDYLYELLGHVPGFQVSRNGDSPSGYTASARGRRNSAEAREILLIVDGQVLADPRTGSADGSLPHFPLVNVERVEVIRGPGSAIYGSGAFTGVVNVIT
jgi:outer membrane receptor for ferrienterochelin and colicins